jgi:hypothetical protein
LETEFPTNLGKKGEQEGDYGDAYIFIVVS